MPTFPKARPGDRTRRHITAAAWNALVDLANDSGGAPIGGADPWRTNNATRILVKADAAYDRFGVIGLSSPLILPTANLAEFQARVAFTGAAPAASNQFKFAILQEPLANGVIGSAIVDGVTPCKLYVANQYHEYADVKAGDKTQLTSSLWGAAQIVWREGATAAGTSEWAIVRIGTPSPQQVLGKTDAAIAKTASGTVSVWLGASPNVVDSGENITAINRFAAVAIGKWVMCSRLHGAWYLTAAEC